jgi:hypothetical protein
MTRDAMVKTRKRRGAGARRRAARRTEGVRERKRN